MDPMHIDSDASFNTLSQSHKHIAVDSFDLTDLFGGDDSISVDPFPRAANNSEFTMLDFGQNLLSPRYF